MTNNDFTQSHKVTYYEADVTNRVTLSMLINMLILVSESQSAEVGVTTEFMNNLGVGWVVTQYHMDITRLPKTGENITLKTRATSYNKYFAFRDYWLIDADGIECVHVSGIWVTMDLQARRIATMPEAVIEPYHAEPVKMIPRLPRPSKIAADEAVTSTEYHVRYFDIDSNGHVNNAHYFDWMMDTLDGDFLVTHTPKTVDLRFENEVRHLDTVTSKVVNQDGLLTKHQICVGDALCAEATITWDDSGIASAPGITSE